MASKSQKPKKRARKPAEKKRPEEHSETCLQMHCRQWLEKSGIWHQHLIFHVANERVGGFGVQMHFKRMGVRPGVADWLMFAPGRRGMAAELKDETGEQSGPQAKFEAQWNAAGFGYVVVRTLEDFQALVNEFFAPKPLPWS